ncbi:hypothetical protein D3C79_1007920 [compost metagenome]
MLQNCLNALSVYLEARYLQLKNGALDKLNTDYLNQLYRLGVRDLYRANGEVFYGEIVGVSQCGQLQVDINNEVKSFSFKEIEFI